VLRLRVSRLASASVSVLGGRRVFAAGLVGLVLYLVGGPLLMLLVSSLKKTEGRLPFEANTPFTLENYSDVFLDTRLYSLLGNTLFFAAGSLAIGFVLSVLLAWLVERTDLPLRNLVFVLIVASSSLPQIISGISWGLLLNPVHGWINVAVRAVGGLEPPGPLNVYTVVGLFFVQGVSLVPITFLLLSASFRAMDATLEDAASASGARDRAVARRITLPLMAPAVVSALIYQFVTVVESFDIPLVIGLRGGVVLLSTQIYLGVNPVGQLPNYGLVSTYGVLMLALAIGPLLIYNAIIGRSPARFATVSGQSYRRKRLRLGKWRLPASAAVLGFLFLTFILPFIVMAWMSIQPFYSVPSAESIARITLDGYESVLDDPRTVTAFVNTFVLGISAAVGAMTIAVCASWLLVRSGSKARFALDALTFAPHAFPGVIIGLSVALLYLTLPLPVYGSIWIIVIAMMTQYISLGTRLMNSGIAQISRELEEAGAVSGATWRQALVRIVGPLLVPAFANGLILVFLASIKNLTLPLMLFSPDSVVLSTLIWNWWAAGYTSETAALGVMMSLLTVALALILRAIGRDVRTA
jgi:iron(III) transport system permease protein